jgi:hypothetical protein
MKRNPIRFLLAAALGVVSIVTIACGGADNLDGAAEPPAGATQVENAVEALSVASAEQGGASTVTPMACPITGCAGDPEDPPPPPPPPPTTYYVGVVPGSTTCPGGVAPIRIYMDDQDDVNKNHWGDIVEDGATGAFTLAELYGWIGAINNASNTTFYFCKVDGRQFKPLTTYPDASMEYAVLKLGTTCPNGSAEVTRRFDNEDCNNANSLTGTITPNTQDRNYTTLKFCVFRHGADAMGGFPSLGISYGVFAPMNFQIALSKGWIFIDDEDGDYCRDGSGGHANNNSLYSADPVALSSFKRMVWGAHSYKSLDQTDRNTYMLFSQVQYQ